MVKNYQFLRLLVLTMAVIPAISLLMPGIYAQPASHDGITLTIHLRGVYESKISVMAMTQSYTMQTILSRDAVKDGDIAVFNIPSEKLPGEFVVRFDYKEKPESTPYPSEKSLIINRQDLEIRAHPMYSNNPDSTWFQDDEQENSALTGFMTENARQKEALGLLQNFLMNYDDVTSDFYLQGIDEYEKRRAAHNQWIRDEIQRHRHLFASTFFAFQLVQGIRWTGDVPDRKQSFIDHYFDLIDLNDSLLIFTRDFKAWMDQYVNLYGEQVTTTAMRDSLFTLAGRTAIEKARQGHPKVYGWMVDYFYRGYESFNIQPGIAMLAPYLDDPNCLTSKRQAILKRVEGMKTIVPGSMAPDFTFRDDTGKGINFHSVVTGTPYKLVLFWSADCPHCMDLVYQLHSWHQQADHRQKLKVFAVSLDDTETEIIEWQQIMPRLTGWQHILTQGGVNSPEANSYFILATPVMVLVNSATNTVVALPESVDQLEGYLN